MLRALSPLSIVLAVLICLIPLPVEAGTTEVRGETGDGAEYAFFVPDGQDGDTWNRKVVFWAHGYVNPAAPVGLPDGSPIIINLRESLLEMGYGVAYSSYSANGFAVAEGTRQTHQLRGLFTSHFGKPIRSYVVGHSMGAAITLALAEKYPKQYDGVLPACGIVGGSQMEWDYIYNTRVLFDYFYPGLPGDAVNVPDGLDFADVAVFVTGAVSTDPLGALQMASVEQLGFPDPLIFPELTQTILNRLFFNTIGASEIQSRTHGHVNFDNTDTYYTGSLDDGALNEGVQRFESHPDADNYMAHYFQASGKLKTPVLALNNTRDPVVPIAHQDALLQIVAAAGSSDMLVLQWIDRFGHCGAIKNEELVKAFLSLVDWVENGVKPMGGHIPLP